MSTDVMSGPVTRTTPAPCGTPKVFTQLSTHPVMLLPGSTRPGLPAPTSIEPASSDFQEQVARCNHYRAQSQIVVSSDCGLPPMRESKLQLPHRSESCVSLESVVLPNGVSGDGPKRPFMDARSRSPSWQESLPDGTSDNKANIVLPTNESNMTQNLSTLSPVTSGVIQGFGILVVLRISEETEDLPVQAVSDNSDKFIGKTPSELLALKSFTSIIEEMHIHDFVERVSLLEQRKTDNNGEGFQAFTVSVHVSQNQVKEFWCVMHRTQEDAGSVICEFESHEDGCTTKHSGTLPLRTSNVMKASIASPVNHVHAMQQRKRPSMRRMDERRASSSVAMDTLNTISRVQNRLATAPDVDSLLKVAVETVKEITGFHRVMVYHFDEKFNARVVTEHTDNRATQNSYLGHIFPASEFTRECGTSHKFNKLRMLYDRDFSSAQLVCRASNSLQHPLNLTNAYLSVMSDEYLQSVTDMAVRSSVSLSISLFDKPWGLFMCHSYGLRGLLMPFPVRSICYLLGDMVSRNIERFSYALQLKAKNMINTLPTLRNSSRHLNSSLEPLLKLLRADFGFFSIRNSAQTFGPLDRSQDALIVLTYLQLKTVTSILTSTNIKSDFPDLQCPFELRSLGGILVVPLSHKSKDFVIFFRKRRQLKEYGMSSDLDNQSISQGSGSHSEFQKTIRVQRKTVAYCQDWTEEDIEIASVFTFVYAKLIEIQGHNEAIMQSSRLTQLLLANSAHEMRTPLNAVINYLELALEGSLDQRVRKRLEKSHVASKRLLHFVHELLKLITGNMLIP